MINRLTRFLQFIRFEHTIFAMPFAMGAMAVASGSQRHGWPGWRVFSLILFSMIFARTAAMTFNRIADWEIDQCNPRTAGRHRLISKSGAITACVVSSLLFIGITGLFNFWCFLFAPLTLAILFFYSLTKRFTSAAQFFLGLALSIAPLGAWFAVRGSLTWAPLILAIAVLFWVSGFDIIYATQDVVIDQRAGLRSMVVWLGVPRALKFAAYLHWLMLLFLLLFGFSANLGNIYFLILIPVPILLLYEHRMARSQDLTKINTAFFKTNVAIGFFFLLSVVMACF